MIGLSTAEALPLLFPELRCPCSRHIRLYVVIRMRRLYFYVIEYYINNVVTGSQSLRYEIYLHVNVFAGDSLVLAAWCDRCSWVVQTQFLMRSPPVWLFLLDRDPAPG